MNFRGSRRSFARSSWTVVGERIRNHEKDNKCFNYSAARHWRRVVISHSDGGLFLSAKCWMTIASIFINAFVRKWIKINARNKRLWRRGFTCCWTRFWKHAAGGDCVLVASSDWVGKWRLCRARDELIGLIDKLLSRTWESIAFRSPSHPNAFKVFFF